MFMNRGRIVFDCSMSELESRYMELTAHREHIAAARMLKPMYEREVFGRSILVFDAVNRPDLAEQLPKIGEVRTPSVADLFVAVLSSQGGPAQGGAQ
jgi:ABC-2 type transport system ATP-binding protein